MSIKLNSLTITDELIKKMKSKIKESEINHTEIGFSLCKERNKNILKIGNECKGTRCSIERPLQICKEKKDEYQGFYHTHTLGTTKPSIADLYGMYIDGLGCIGSVKEDKIKCFVRKKSVEFETIEKLEDAYYLFKRLRNELPKEEFDKMHDESIKHLTNENFNVVDVK